MYGNKGMVDSKARIERIRRLWLFGSEGESGTGTNPPSVDPPATDPPATDPPAPVDPPEPDTFDRAYVTKIREEAAANRVKAKELEAKLKEYEDRDLSEIDKAKKDAEAAAAERDGLRAELVETRRESLVHKVAAELKFNDPVTTDSRPNAPSKVRSKRS
jgi:pyruvate/2-oxoglutarate dehydrogenase complex dihydrolipoamide acyltransferase (E2) component